MRLPCQTTSGETLQGTYGLYHLARLKSDPQCCDLATTFQLVQNQLKARLDGHDAARANAITALAVRDARRAAFGRQVRRFCLAVLARVNSSRRAPLYQTYFAAGLRAVVRAPIDVALMRGEVILAKLNEETDPQLTVYFQPLRAATDTLHNAHDAHRAAMGAEANGFGLLRAESIRWVDAYRLSYRELQRRFYRDCDYAESFFCNPTVTRGGVQDGDVVAEGPAVVAASGAPSGAASGVEAGAPQGITEHDPQPDQSARDPATVFVPVRSEPIMTR
jgi:hypothetical protein